MFVMSRQLKGALMAAGGGVCWGISGTMGQYLFTHEAMQTTWLIPIRLGLAGLILSVYRREAEREIREVRAQAGLPPEEIDGLRVVTRRPRP